MSETLYSFLFVATCYWLCATAAASAGVHAVNGSSAVSWGARVGHVYAYDKITAQLLVIGGADTMTGPYHNDLWSTNTAPYTNGTRVNSSAPFGPRAFGGALFLDDGSLIVMGGQNESTALADVWYSSDQGVSFTQWSAPWPARAFFGYAKTSDAVVIWGGYNSFTGTALDDVWSSSDSGYSWTRIDNATSSTWWDARYGFGFASSDDGGSLWMTGGINANGYMFADVWRSTNGGVTWSSIGNSGLPSQRIGALMLGFNKHELLVLSGSQGANGGALNSFRYTKDALNWCRPQQTREPFSVGRMYMAGAVIDGVGYVSGGFHPNGSALSDAFVIQPKGLTCDVYELQWRIVRNTDFARIGAAGAALGEDQLFAVFVGGSVNLTNEGVTDSVYVTTNGLLYSILDTPFGGRARWQHVAARNPVDTNVYVAGGIDKDGVFLHDLWSFDGVSWTEIPLNASYGRRAGFGMSFDINGNLFVAGGYTPESVQTTVMFAAPPYTNFRTVSDFVDTYSINSRLSINRTSNNAVFVTGSYPGIEPFQSQSLGFNNVTQLYDTNSTLTPWALLNAHPFRSRDQFVMEQVCNKLLVVGGAWGQSTVQNTITTYASEDGARWYEADPLPIIAMSNLLGEFNTGLRLAASTSKQMWIPYSAQDGRWETMIVAGGSDGTANALPNAYVYAANPCTSFPCQNGATCTPLLVTYQCTCTSKFSGAVCETPNSATDSSSNLSPAVLVPVIVMSVLVASLLVVLVYSKTLGGHAAYSRVSTQDHSRKKKHPTSP